MGWLQGPTLPNFNNFTSAPAPTKKTTSVSSISSPSFNLTNDNTGITALRDAATAESAALPNAPTSTYVDPAAAAAAQKAAEVAKYRGDANAKLDAYNNMFGSLYGRVNAASADQANKTRTAYAGQRQSVTEDYNGQLPQVDMSYYLSGVGDSSLRLAAVGQAEKAYNQSLGKIDNAEQTDLASIGKEQATTTAKYRAQQSSIARIRDQAAQTDDPAELKKLIAEITTNTDNLNADQASFDTEAGYRGRLAGVAPTQDVQPVIDTLNTLIKGAANPALKQKIAKQIIDNAAVSGKTKEDLYAQYVSNPVAG